MCHRKYGPMWNGKYINWFVSVSMTIKKEQHRVPIPDLPLDTNPFHVFEATHVRSQYLSMGGVCIIFKSTSSCLVLVSTH